METKNLMHSMSSTSHIPSFDGVPLMVEHYAGQPHGPLLLTHGFGQTRNAWQHSATALAQAGWDVFSYDARGHGDSGRPEDGEYDLDHFIDDFRYVHQHIVDQCQQEPIVVGASMGGLITMLSQAEAPAVPLRALVLVDIAPRWEQKGVSRMLGFMQKNADGFASLDEAREVVRAYLPHRENAGGSLRHNLRQHDDGRWYWHWDPRMLDYAMRSADYQDRIAAGAKQVSAPTLLVSGGQTDMISDEHINELLHMIPHASHVVVPKAAHMVAGDDNDRFNAAITGFLNDFIQPSLQDCIPEEA